MAYQQQGGMGNGPPGPGEHHGPQGTEYTLQGMSHMAQLYKAAATAALKHWHGGKCRQETKSRCPADLNALQQVSCASSKSNGTATNGRAMLGI
jgi:hypothetical protein